MLRPLPPFRAEPSRKPSAPKRARTIRKESAPIIVKAQRHPVKVARLAKTVSLKVLGAPAETHA